MSALLETIKLDDYFSLSVGGTNIDYRGLRGENDKGEIIPLDVMADNIDVLRHIAAGDEIRWLMLTSLTATLPYDRTWKAAIALSEVSNISMGQKLARQGIDTTGFQGRVDYVLINHLKLRQMLVLALFDHDGDATLHKLRG